jgi:prevent-host-death family protein
MGSWQLSEAKNRLSEVVASARQAAQVITVHGRETAVVISVEEYRRLTRPKSSFVAFLRESPLAEEELDLERDGDPGREVTF